MKATILNSNYDPITFLEKFQQWSNSLYSDYRWLIVLSKTFSIKQKIFICEEQEAIIGILVFAELNNPIFGNSLISLPFLNHGYLLLSPVLSPEQQIIARHSLFSALDAQTKDYKYIEYRSDLCPEQGIPPQFICRDHKVTFRLSITDGSEKVFSKFDKKLRSQIKKSIKNQARSEIITKQNITQKDCHDFYQIMAEHWRDLGSPIYPKVFFEEIFKNFSEDLVLTFASVKNKRVATALSIKKNQSAEICWAASLKKYHKLATNLLLYWVTIEYLANNEIKSFDFGRCSKNSGTYNFKKQWGGIEQQLYWYYSSRSQIPEVNQQNPKFKLPIRIWKHLPLPLATFIGSRVSRFFP